MKFITVLLSSTALLTGVLAVPSPLTASDTCEGRYCSPSANSCCPEFPHCVQHGEMVRIHWCQGPAAVSSSGSCEGRFCKGPGDCCGEFSNCVQHGEMAGIKWCKK